MSGDGVGLRGFFLLSDHALGLGLGGLPRHRRHHQMAAAKARRAWPAARYRGANHRAAASHGRHPARWYWQDAAQTGDRAVSSAHNLLLALGNVLSMATTTRSCQTTGMRPLEIHAPIMQERNPIRREKSAVLRQLKISPLHCVFCHRRRHEARDHPRLLLIRCSGTVDQIRQIQIE
jgi:hypothetical protein